MDLSNRMHFRKPWNKGKLVGQKASLKVKDIWAIRVRLQMHGLTRDLALFDLGIDSKLRSCDLVKLRVRDVCHGGQVSSRAIVLQQKTQRPIQFEITPATREAVAAWIKSAALRSDDYLFPSRLRVTAPRHAAVCSDRGWLGRGDRARSRGVRNPFDPAYEADADLQANEESPGRSASAWSHEARKHGQVPRYRG